MTLTGPGTSSRPRRSAPSRLGSSDEMDRIAESAIEAAAFLKTLGHEGRLMILCHLVTGEKSVTELKRLLGSRQAAVSQQLARLRAEGLVRARRDGKTIHYSLADERPRAILGLIYDMFCGSAPKP